MYNKKQKESKYQVKIKKYLQENNWLVEKTAFVTIGYPDLIAFRNGKTIFIECKTPIGKHSPTQKFMINLLLSINFDVYTYHETLHIGLNTNNPLTFERFK